jgi:hypothetical protein
VHLHVTQISAIEKNLPQVEPIWTSEEKYEHPPKVEPGWIPQIGMKFQSLSSADIF